MIRLHESVVFQPEQIRALKKLVSGGESVNLEFKRKATSPERIVREMIAFANTTGGTLLLGVNDDGQLTGLKHPEGESWVVQKALLKCKPRLPVTETFIPLGDARHIIRYDIAESKRKPHYLVEGDKKDAFVRVHDQSIRASREVREIARRSNTARNIRFHYGDHEQLLMQYLAKEPSITLKQFMEVSGLKRFHASRKLVLLVLANVLSITPHEKGDLYSMIPVAE